MVNTQEYLNKEYPTKKEKKNIKEIDIFVEGIEGHLDLSDFVNLKVLNCSGNELTSIDLSKNHKLENVVLWGNKISANLTIFSHLVNLKTLDVGTIDGYSNDFYGSLKALEDCEQLEYLCIGQNKRITEGLEYLPHEKLTYLGTRGTIFEKMLKPYGYGSKGLKKWREANPILISRVYKVQKERITKLETENNETKSQLRDLTIILFSSSSDSDISNIPFSAVKMQAEKNQAKIQELTNELEIEQDHSRDIDNWYRNSITAELNNQITNLELSKEKEIKKKEAKIQQLENELAKLKLQLEQSQGLEAKIVNK